MPTDPTTDLIQQLTRIADALSKSGPTVWTEWVKTLATFVLGMVATYTGIWLQAQTGDARERKKMRRVVYTELTNSVLWLFDLADGLPKAGPPKVSTNSEGVTTVETQPPGYKVFNSPFTFEGFDFMKQNHNTAYELPEMAVLKRMYVELERWTPGYSISRGQIEGQLVRFADAFKSDANVRKGFLEFSGIEHSTIEAVAKHYAGHKIKPEDLLITTKRKSPA